MTDWIRNRWTPEHGPGCKGSRKNAKCSSCDRGVVQLKCSCGSLVQLEPRGEDEIHICLELANTRAKVLRKVVTRVRVQGRPTQCPICGTRIDAAGFGKHLQACNRARLWVPMNRLPPIR